MNTRILAYCQTIFEQRLQAKKEDTKTTQNLKSSKTRSPNFETEKVQKNYAQSENK